MRVAVVRFPGSNCDADAVYALERAGADAYMVWHRESDLAGADAVIVPGGFSYGDYLRSGAMAALSPIMGSVRRFAERGGPVLGICNGFQILTEAGLLPGQLARNPELHFLCRTVTVKVERNDTIFSEGYESGAVISLPIAHNEGSYYADDETLRRLEQNRQIVFRYCDASGAVDPASNPNGSMKAIAGIVNEGGNVLGMMPHPERAVEALLGSCDGQALFASLLQSRPEVVAS